MRKSETKYYYYKKKIGRHKKTGAKKKKKTRGRRWQEPWDFKIIKFVSRKQDKYIGSYHDIKETECAKRILSYKNQEVVFPKRFASTAKNKHQIQEYLAEYVILKRIRESGVTDNTSLIRNEYGKFVKHKYTDKDWIIFDKIPCLDEETFWVYGFNPRTDRKTFTWIYDNFIDQKSDLVIVYVYGNKVILKYDLEIEFVLCKNQTDAIRMYNMMEEKSKKKKNVVFSGMITRRTGRLEQTIGMIEEKTGWNRRKITRNSTRT